MIIGNLLGDAWMERRQPNWNARLRYEQTSPKHDERFFFVWKYYALMCAGNPKIRVRTDNRSGVLKIQKINHFSTRSLPYFNIFHSLFYVNKIKTIPNNIIDYLTPVVLAFWIMDDGHEDSGLVLNTQGYSVEGVKLLIKALNEKYSFHSYIRYEKNKPIIYIPQKDKLNLKNLVIPYMHKSTYYKLGL